MPKVLVVLQLAESSSPVWEEVRDFHRGRSQDGMLFISMCKNGISHALDYGMDQSVCGRFLMNSFLANVPQVISSLDLVTLGLH